MLRRRPVRRSTVGRRTVRWWTEVSGNRVAFGIVHRQPIHAVIVLRIARDRMHVAASVRKRFLDVVFDQHSRSVYPEIIPRRRIR
jgi:hypothetical protein